MFKLFTILSFVLANVCFAGSKTAAVAATANLTALGVITSSPLVVKQCFPVDPFNSNCLRIVGVWYQNTGADTVWVNHKYDLYDAASGRWISGGSDGRISVPAGQERSKGFYIQAHDPSVTKYRIKVCVEALTQQGVAVPETTLEDNCAQIEATAQILVK